MGEVVAGLVFAITLVCTSACQADSPSSSPVTSGSNPDLEYKPSALYPSPDRLTLSPGSTAYFVDPVNGDDARSGKQPASAWKSLARVNALALRAGDRVVIAPGDLHETLKPNAIGTVSKPVIVQFSEGRHIFRADRAIRLRYFVSNSADAPDIPRPIGILIKNCRHLRIVGRGHCDILYGDRMTQMINDQSEDITYAGLSFDMIRPTVSEYRVLATGANTVDIQVAEGSTYTIDQGRFSWTGDIGPGWTMVQEANPETGQCWRRGQWDPFSAARAEDLGGSRVRLTYKSGVDGMLAGHQYQFRNVERDTTSAVNTRCKDMTFRDCNFYALPGMGIVSQFTENLVFERVNVIPRPGTIRTCAAWADCFHFSGCRGRILVDSCKFSGTQDDPINIHGTYLRLIEKTAPSQVLVRFMHPQTYGFAAFQAGDRVHFVNHAILLPYAAGRIKSVERKTDKDWLLTLDGDIPRFAPNDVVDNISWYPDVTIRHCSVTMDSCRGFLITTRGKVVVEDNVFTRTAMSAIDISDDANSWFESGSVHDVTIRRNRFIECGEPVIRIWPEIQAAKPDEPVHENIRIVDNFFEGGGVSARSVKGLTITGNRFTANTLPVQQEACTEVKMDGNKLGIKD
jgi:hypothetical protein